MKYLWVYGLLLLPQLGLAQEKAHQHGIATAALVVDAGQIDWEMDIPAAQLFGFEHAATTDSERQQQQAQLEKLQPHSWLVWPQGAGCTLKSATLTVESPTSTHQDYVSKASWQCQDINAIHQLQVDLFSLTIGLEQLQMQYVTPAGQGGTTLTMDTNVLEFSR